MINQNLQMNKFKDLLKNFSRRLERIERYASQSARIRYTVADGFSFGMTVVDPTLGNSTVDCSFTRNFRQFTMTFDVLLGSTYVNGNGSMWLNMPWPLDVTSSGKLIGTYWAVPTAAQIAAGEVRHFGPILGTSGVDADKVYFSEVPTGVDFASNNPWVWTTGNRLVGQMTGHVADGY